MNTTMGSRGLIFLPLLLALASAQNPQPQKPKPEPVAETKENAEAARAQLNLLGQTDTVAGESRRNENVKFNPIDNNSLREVNVRIGTTATLVEEFDPSRNYFSAEYGTRPDAPLHVIAAPATSIHGSLFETHNNSVFSARSFFQAGDVKPARENNYGFTLGTPLWTRARILFEGSQQKVRGNVNGNVLVPNANERTPLTNDPLVRPIVERYLAAYPNELPNRTDIDDRALNTNSPQRIDTDRIGATLDQILTPNQHLVLRYGLTAQEVQAFQFVAGQNPDSDIRAHSARITWTRVWGAAVLLDLSAGFDRVGTILRPEPRAVTPFLSTFIVQRIGSMGIPVDRAINDFRYGGNLRLTRGRHSWTTGFALLRRQFNGSEASDHLGTFYFSDAFGRDAVSNIRMGTPLRYTVTIGETGRHYRNWQSAFYIGDRWQAGSGLTIQYGLRYETSTQPVETRALDVLPFGCDCNNVAPSLAIAYQLPGRWGTLRTAYGVHFGRIFPATYGQVRFNPPGNFNLNVDSPNLANPLAGIDLTRLTASARSGLNAISPDLTSPYSHQYNFSWEPGAVAGLRLQLGYVGSRTHKLFTLWTTNRAVQVPGIPLTIATVNQRRPDPRYFTVLQISNSSRAWYDAARISVVMPQRRRFSLDASYWFSKALDLGADYSATGAGATTPSQSDYFIHDDVKGVSNFHQPHAFLTRASYELPPKRIVGSWRTSLILLMKSGTPFSVFSGSDAPGFGNVDGESGDRVHIVDPSILGRTVGHPDTSVSLLPRDAFRFMSPGDLRGSIGRNTFRKGRIANVNAAVSRSWRFGSDQSLTFRAESINLLNTPQFADPERNFTSKTFARITNTLNEGRTFQFALRFDF
jgi:hypothetical protein